MLPRFKVHQASIDRIRRQLYYGDENEYSDAAKAGQLVAAIEITDIICRIKYKQTDADPALLELKLTTGGIAVVDAAKSIYDVLIGQNLLTTGGTASIKQGILYAEIRVVLAANGREAIADEFEIDYKKRI